MADIIVPLVLEPIRDLLVAEAKFLHGIKAKAEQLKIGLGRMQWFLKDAEAKRVRAETIKEWVAEFREIAYDAEDVLESYAYKMRQIRRRRREAGSNFLHSLIVKCGSLSSELRAAHKAGAQIEDLINKIKDLEDSFSKLGVRAAIESENLESSIVSSTSTSAATKQQMLRRTYSHVVEEDFVGFGEDVGTLVHNLVNEDSVRVVSIIGMGGCGKTATAAQIYNHEKIKNYFEIRTWAYVSQKWHPKGILLQILTKIRSELRLGPPSDTTGEEALVREIYNLQMNKKCLFVLDDVWDTEAWDSIKSAFQKHTKILVTTRKEPVASHIGSPGGYHYKPPLLDGNQSFDLLQRKALSRKRQDKDTERLEKLGRQMVEKCGGLPLAVAVLGGILATKFTVEEWETVHKHVLESAKGWEDVLALSYHDLPYQLKRCLLYMVAFPPGEYIDEKFLYHLWMGEGLVSIKDKMGEEEILMDVAERYLEMLVERSMVLVEHVWPSRLSWIGRFRSMRLHDLMRDVCRQKAMEENFIQVIDDSKISNTPYDVDDIFKSNIRRLVIHSTAHQDQYLSRMTSSVVKHVRSLLLRIPSLVQWDWRVLGPLIDAQLDGCITPLRVLAVENLELPEDAELPKSVARSLSLLRFLRVAGSSYVARLPSALGGLDHLQTLDLRNIRIQVISAVIEQLTELRHLYLPESPISGQVFRPEKEHLRFNRLEKLELLENFATSYCNAKDLSKLTNLRLLHVRVFGEGSHLEDVINGVKDLSRLRFMRLDIYNVSFIPKYKGQSTFFGRSRLDRESIFSRALGWLTLTECEIQDADTVCETLEKFLNLTTFDVDECEVGNKEYKWQACYRSFFDATVIHKLVADHFNVGSNPPNIDEM